jgi:bifunctional oligoribonuclease and PAP phosphatase NrnA
MLEIEEQFFTAIDNSKNVLIAFPKSCAGDAISSSLALYFFLKKLNKNVTITCDNFKPLEKFDFLPGMEKIKPEIKEDKEFIISLNTSKIKVDSLKYEKEDGSLDIIIEPKEGNFTSKDVSFSGTSSGYDLIITISSPDLESLGKIFENNADLFYNTPIINIDKSPSNEQYGQINLVKLASSSVSEIVYSLLTSKDKSSVDEKIAELILTGIIDDTNSFKSLSVTPYTLTAVSKLISLGADREKIVKNLYQVYSVDNLKLWGRVLARLKEKNDGRLVWSLLTKEDFAKTKTGENDINGVIDELIIHMPKIEIACLFYQDPKGQIKVIIKNRGEGELMSVLEKYNPSGNNKIIILSFNNKGLIDTEKEIISILNQSLVS